MLRPGFPRNERVCCGCVVRGRGGKSEYVCGNGVEDKISWGGSGAVALLLAEDSYSFTHVARYSWVQMGVGHGPARL